MDTILLKKIIEDRGIKYQYLAKELGISRESLYNKVNGKTEFTAWEIRSIAKTLALDFLTIQTIFFN